MTGSPYRLNSKINVREVAVNDLVTDLSDGVGALPSTTKDCAVTMSTGYPHTPSRDPRQRITGPLCLEAKAAGSAV